MARLMLAIACVLAVACGDDSGPDGPGGDGWVCGMEMCRVGAEACIFPSFDAPRCEPLVGAGLMGLERCRAHVDAYCGGNGERCDEGTGDAGALPAGGYQVLCR